MPEPKTIEVEKCPGCGTPCEVTAEYKAADIILVSFGDGNTCEFGYYGGPVYRVICLKCKATAVSASIMGLPVNTTIAIKLGPPAPITNLMVKPEGVRP